jgi:ribonucleoside-triphosphate reductase
MLPYYTLSPTYSVCKNHGYIAGEVYSCPHCGEKTEVYSRITGYYRPVQNWNDGKSQEYKDRVVYSPKHFSDKGPILGAMPYSESCESVCNTSAVSKLLLFTTTTCPKCRMAKSFLDKAGIEYEVVLANDAPELVELYGVREAPTLVIVAEDGSFQKVANPSNIKAFTEKSLNA